MLEAPQTAAGGSDANRYTLKDKIRAIGPGIIIIGSFLGPGTITTATRTGASFGYSLLWTIVFSVLATIILQEMASRIGIISQKGLAEHITEFFEKNKFLKTLSIYFVGGAITLGGVAYMSGDLLGTSLGISQITGLPREAIAPFIGLLILFIINVGTVKWLEYILGALVATMVIIFVMTMFIVQPDLSEMAAGLVPSIPENGLLYCVALIGTTIVPYNLFIHCTNAKDKWNKPEHLTLSRWDITVSVIIGGIITMAVMVTAGTIMRGMEVNSVADLSVQLEPVLGSYANLVMSLGLFAAGLSSAIITPLGVSYVLSGLLGWQPNKTDKRFVFTNIAILVIGIIGATTGFNPLTVILMAQALNGVFLPVIVIAVVVIASLPKVLGENANSGLQKFLGAGIILVTAAIGIKSLASMF